MNLGKLAILKLGHVNKLDYKIETETDLKTMKNAVLEMAIRKKFKKCKNGSLLGIDLFQPHMQTQLQQF